MKQKLNVKQFKKNNSLLIKIEIFWKENKKNIWHKNAIFYLQNQIL